MDSNQPPAPPPPNIPFSLDELADYFVQNWEEVTMVATGHPLFLIISGAIVALVTWLVFYLLHKRQLDEIRILERQNALKDDDLKRKDDDIVRLKQLLEEATRQPLTEPAKPLLTAENPPLNINEILHPPEGGVLWRRDQKSEASGPFCPHHKSRLFYRDHYANTDRIENFDKHYLSGSGWFVCPLDPTEEFSFLNLGPITVGQLRERAAERLRVKLESE